MKYLKTVLLPFVIAMLTMRSAGDLSGIGTKQTPSIEQMRSKTTDIVLGIVISLSYNESADAASLARERTTIGYKLSFLPIHTIKGSILPFDERASKGLSECITVNYMQISPLNILGDDGVRFQPMIGLTYMLFLTRKDVADEYELADSRFGLLPVLPALMREQAGERSEWALLVSTLESSDMPRWLHDSLYDFMISSAGVTSEQKVQLRRIHTEYYKKQMGILNERLDEIGKER